MKLSRHLLIKGIALVGLVAIFAFATKEGKEGAQSLIDIRAALLVFAAPILVLALFQKESIQWFALLGRMREVSKISSQELAQELEKNTLQSRGQYGFSHVVKLSEGHSDSLVRYAGELYSARFSNQEIAQLLVQRMQSEDQEWSHICAAFGFLAKMAPYFGMLATVLGMIKLLENMSDFTRISSSMALAMQGTLYGLLSFTVLYSPFQRFFIDFKNQILRRNEMVARWFILLSQQVDPVYIQQELRSQYLENGQRAFAEGMSQVAAQSTSSARSSS